MTDERYIEVNNWLNTVTSIGYERVSKEVEGEYLTKWDEDSYNVGYYVDGRVEKTLIHSSRPSVMLKHIEKVFNNWSLELNMSFGKNRLFSESLIFGDSHITVYMNCFHKDMISDDPFGCWYTYKDGVLEVGHQILKLEEWIALLILKGVKKSDIQLQRTIKLKALL